MAFLKVIDNILFCPVKAVKIKERNNEKETVSNAKEWYRMQNINQKYQKTNAGKQNINGSMKISTIVTAGMHKRINEVR